MSCDLKTEFEIKLHADHCRQCHQCYVYVQPYLASAFFETSQSTHVTAIYNWGMSGHKDPLNPAAPNVRAGGMYGKIHIIPCAPAGLQKQCRFGRNVSTLFTFHPFRSFLSGYGRLKMHLNYAEWQLAAVMLLCYLWIVSEAKSGKRISSHYIADELLEAKDDSVAAL
jgi:hypothetical protein